MNRRIEPERSARSFEKAKLWSDYLSFYIRSFFFFSLFIVALLKVRDLTSQENAANAAIGIEVYVLILGATCFFAFGAVMVFRTIELTFEFLMSFVGGRSNSWLLILTLIFVVTIQAAIMTSILMSFFSLGVLEAWL